MEQALYRKYRPRDFNSAIAQDHIVKTLENAIKSGRISHAYLFTGPRGVGKTSIARILAHEINRLPYSDDSLHLDIIEIDAASNRRIDEIRDLRDRVRIAPTSAKYKVYIIDEVHMLTREAFNALLKTLEEPPAHCVFILATTEAHKLPETIISRTQRFEFKPVSPKAMAEHLGKIAKSEKIDITMGALELLAKAGEGSFRDSIGYLDQLSSEGKAVDEETVREILGLPSKEETIKLAEALESGDLAAAAALIDEFQMKGINAPELAVSLSELLREKIMSGGASDKSVSLLKDLLEVRSSSRPQEYLEIILLDYASKNHPAENPGRKNKPRDDNDHKKQDAKTKSTEVTASESELASTAIDSFSLDRWEDVVSTARDKAASIYTALRLAEPLLDGDKLILQFKFPLHQKKLEQIKNKDMVASIIDELFGQRLVIESVVNKEIKKQLPRIEQADSSADLHSISNIFGSAEMIET